MVRSLQATSPYLPSAYCPLTHPAHPTISDLNCRLQTKLYQQQTKDKLLPCLPFPCLSPTHHFYPAIVLANNRAQGSIFHHKEHLHLGLGRASWQGYLASGERSDVTFIKSLMTTTEVH